MDKKIAGLLGAAAALTVIPAAQASAPSLTQLDPPTTYQDLLTPVSNAVEALKADNARLAETPVSGGIQTAQYYYHHHHHHGYYHHHHHHHLYFRRFFFRRYYHHHHHHHHHGYYYGR